MLPDRDDRLSLKTSALCEGGELCWYKDDRLRLGEDWLWPERIRSEQETVHSEAEWIDGDRATIESPVE